jgi:hypothetical protein
VYQVIGLIPPHNLRGGPKPLLVGYTSVTCRLRCRCHNLALDLLPSSRPALRPQVTHSKAGELWQTRVSLPLPSAILHCASVPTHWSIACDAVATILVQCVLQPLWNHFLLLCLLWVSVPGFLVLLLHYLFSCPTASFAFSSSPERHTRRCCTGLSTQAQCQNGSVSSCARTQAHHHHHED